MYYNSKFLVTLTGGPVSPLSPFLPFLPRLPGGPGGPVKNQKINI